MYKHKHGLVIMRCQPFHKGHERIINQMIEECENVTIILGSIQEHYTKNNPFDYEMRKKMIQNVFQDKLEFAKLNIFGLPDIPNDDEWADFVLDSVREKIKKVNEVDAVYCGTDFDGHWFKNKQDITVVNVDRTNKSYPYISASTIRDMWKYKDDRWKDFVNKKNWQLIKDFLKTKREIFS